MDGPQVDVDRIIVMARPAVGRRVEAILRGAGYEVHRTPDDGALSGLVTRLRARLVIVALDLSWVDPLEAVQLLMAGPRPVPVLLLGEALGDPRVDAMLRLPLAVDAPLLLGAVSSLLTTADSGPGCGGGAPCDWTQPMPS